MANYGNTKHEGFHETALGAVNDALVVLGHDALVTDLSATSEQMESRKAAHLFEQARTRVLREHAWNFARREEAANPRRCAECMECDGASLVWETDAPPKCVRVLEVASGPAGASRPCRWRIVGGTIRSDLPPTRIVYTHDERDLDRWLPDAYRALVLRLAADLAKPVTGRINERQLQESAYSSALADAKLGDARESSFPTDPWDDAPYVEAMRGGALGRERGRMPPPWAR